MSEQGLLKALSGSEAVALAVRQADVDVIAAYPITPQTGIVERLAEYVHDGELDAEYVAAESEHSALSICIGASLTGARVFTATSSQGLALMHEVLYIASGLRCPLVMVITNRALSAPINIHRDHSDVMGSRESGWIQIFAEDSQQAYDRVLQAFKLSEDREIQLPVAVNIDGFFVSHTIERVETLPQEHVSLYLPPRRAEHYLDHSTPKSFGAAASPDWYYEIKHQVAEAMERVWDRLEGVEKPYQEVSGRRYGVVGAYMMDDAKVAIVCAGATAGTAKAAASALRRAGIKAGVLSIRLFRPFPQRELIRLAENLEAMLVVDLAMSPGAPSAPIGQDVKATLFDAGVNIPVLNAVCGLGGRDISQTDLEELVRMSLEKTRHRGVMYWGLRKWP